MSILSQVISRILGPAALIAVVIVSPAAAQPAQNMQKYGDPDKVKSQADIAAEKEAEKAYQRSLGNIPAQKESDPWGTVRSENAPPKAAKAAPVKPKAKTAQSQPAAKPADPQTKQ
ncbi:MAG: hypothetical protein ABJA75_25105 [Bradyrhizobium sp.]